jgi:cytochrome c oxidase assembly protein subunit 15
VAAIAALQTGLGTLNVLLLAPVWLQLAHLLVADLLWIALVLLAATALAANPARVAAPAAARRVAQPA